MKKNEQLDTLGCIKRFYPIASRQKKHFHDLSDIAVIPFLEKINYNENLKAILSDYEQFFINDNIGLRPNESKKHSNVNLQILSDLLFINGEKDLQSIEIKESQNAWKKYKKLTDEGNAGTPNKYACILVGDGDNMGIALDKIHSLKGHQTFSKYMSKFTKEVESVIENSSGSLIYAGGDDVMAYLPIHNAIECSDKIRLLFLDIMDNIFSELNLDGDKPSFSIGLSIVHHSAPLTTALETARKAEKLAKAVDGKNAFAIIQSKRGGHDISIAGKWEDDGESRGILTKLNKMIELYNSNEKMLPHTLGYQLRQAEIESGGSKDNEIKMKFEIQGKQLIATNAPAVNVLRIFKQKYNADQIIQLLEGRTKIKNLSNELVIARQIAEVIKLTKHTQEEE